MRRIWQFVRNTASGAYARSDATPFIIVFVARTGSNYLAGMLDSHPEIICHHEVYNPEGIHRSLTYKNTDVSFGTVAERNRDPWTMMQRIFQFTDGARAVGFKMSPREDDWALASLLLTRRVRKIVLRRRNWLEAFTSGLIAAETQVWSQSPGADRAGRSSPARVHVDVDVFRRYASKRDAFYLGLTTLLRTTGQRFFSLDYADIGETETTKRLLQFLGVTSDMPLKVRTEKQNPGTLRDRITNYEEVARALHGTRYANLV